MNIPIISQLPHLQKWVQARFGQNGHGTRTDLHQLATDPEALPQFVQESPVAMRYLRLLSPLGWSRFPERDLETEWARTPSPYAPFAAACLVKLDQGFVYMPHLRTYLVEHPALTWVLGFPLIPSSAFPYGFDTDASLPSARHFTRMLRVIPNDCLQFLLDETVRLLCVELSTEIDNFGESISLDTKHIIAWVKENNPKAYAVTAMTRKSSQPVTPTVAWAANADVTNALHLKTRRPPLATIHYRQTPFPSANTTGATLPAWRRRRRLAGASSFWLNSHNLSTVPIFLTSTHCCKPPSTASASVPGSAHLTRGSMHSTSTNTSTGMARDGSRALLLCLSHSEAAIGAPSAMTGCRFVKRACPCL
jgi:hypothetical protein